MNCRNDFSQFLVNWSAAQGLHPFTLHTNQMSLWNNILFLWYIVNENQVSFSMVHIHHWMIQSNATSFFLLIENNCSINKCITPLKTAPPLGHPRLIHGSLKPPESSAQTAPLSVHVFFARAHQSIQQTHRHAASVIIHILHSDAA